MKFTAPKENGATTLKTGLTELRQDAETAAGGLNFRKICESWYVQNDHFRILYLTLEVRLKKWCSALDFSAEHLFNLRII